MDKAKMLALLLISCIFLKYSSDHALNETESAEEVNFSHEKSLFQTDAPAPYPGNTLTNIYFKYGPQSGFATKLVELNPEGNIIWNYTYTPNGRAGLIFDVELLQNGNILFAGNFGEDIPQFWGDDLHSQVTEMTRSGEIIWTYDLYSDYIYNNEIHDVDKLENGNVLIADINQDRVIEVTMDHQIVWEWRASDWFDPPVNLDDWTHLNDVDRLPNGHTLISFRNLRKVIEVNETGHIVWSWGNSTNLGEPHNPDKLLNGNVLICDSGYNRIIEVNTTTDEIVWQYEGQLYWPRDADRLPNGNTLIADSLNDRVLEITPEGEIVWEQTGLTMVYEADRLNNVPPTLSIDSPNNQTYSTVHPIEIDLSSPDWDLSKLWFRIYDDTNNIWIDSENVTWSGEVQRELPPGSYTLFSYANDSSDWWQGDDVHVSLITMASVSFSVVKHDIMASKIWVWNIYDSNVQIERGQQVPVHVNVINQGSVEERVRVNLMGIMRDPDWMNVTTTQSNTTISSQIVTLASRTSQIITFEWDTSETILGSYELVATVDLVPDENDTENNSVSIFVLINTPSPSLTVSEHVLYAITGKRTFVSVGIILFFVYWRFCKHKKQKDF